MRLSFSRRLRPASAEPEHATFCNEPWVGVLGIEVDESVTFCPCYLKLRLGSLREQPLEELWNAPALVSIREDFRDGRLPRACQGQLCPPALGAESYLSTVPDPLPPGPDP